MFGSIEEMIASAAEAIRPARRMTVAEAAEEYRFVNVPGAYVGPWKNKTTPYLVEPMNVLTSWRYTGMVFVGAAQTGKTDMFLNWLAYSAICDPADMMLIQTSKTTARDFSVRRIDRLHRYSPQVGERLLDPNKTDNIFDKTYRSGMLLTMSWPSVNELAGKPIPRLWLTDYDRMKQDVDGEGAPFFLAQKRATTFRSNGMCAAESSPSFPVEKSNWVRTTRHEAPPCQGILSLYNKGDRRRWYVQCVDCRDWFEPAFDLLAWEDLPDPLAASDTVRLNCPHCGGSYRHDPEEGRPGKHMLNHGGRWVPDNCTIDPDGNIHGTPPRSLIASFWFKGVAAAFSDWRTLVFNYLQATREYERTGSEEALKTTVNVDQGEAYIPKTLASNRVPETLKARMRDRGVRVVPKGVRFLIATVDIQKHRFVVQVHGITRQSDIVVIDRFDIQKSRRPDKVAGGMCWVNPGAYAEDWKLLADEVMHKTYELGDGSGRRMAVKHTFCDSGGREGVTANAYAFYRWLRWGNAPDSADEGTYDWQPGMAGRFTLVKGATAKDAPRVRLGFPDSQRKEHRAAEARGEIPVLFINTNALKDMLDNRLNRTDPGGQIEFPNWLDDNFFIELTVEVKDPIKGAWVNPHNYRNESWDLLVYCIAGTLTPGIGLEHIDFDNPPGWAGEWDRNDLVFNPEVAQKPFVAEKGRSLSDLARDLA